MTRSTVGMSLVLYAGLTALAMQPQASAQFAGLEARIDAQMWAEKALSEPPSAWPMGSEAVSDERPSLAAHFAEVVAELLAEGGGVEAGEAEPLRRPHGDAFRVPVELLVHEEAPPAAWAVAVMTPGRGGALRLTEAQSPAGEEVADLAELRRMAIDALLTVRSGRAVTITGEDVTDLLDELAGREGPPPADYWRRRIEEAAACQERLKRIGRAVAAFERETGEQIEANHLETLLVPDHLDAAESLTCPHGGAYRAFEPAIELEGPPAVLLYEAARGPSHLGRHVLMRSGRVAAQTASEARAMRDLETARGLSLDPPAYIEAAARFCGYVLTGRPEARELFFDDGQLGEPPPIADPGETRPSVPEEMWPLIAGQAGALGVWGDSLSRGDEEVTVALSFGFGDRDLEELPPIEVRMQRDPRALGRGWLVTDIDPPAWPEINTLEEVRRAFLAYVLDTDPVALRTVARDPVFQAMLESEDSAAAAVWSDLIATSRRCSQRVERLANALRAYLEDHGGAPPQAGLRDALYPDYVSDAALFECPEGRPYATPAPPPDAEGPYIVLHDSLLETNHVGYHALWSDGSSAMLTRYELTRELGVPYEPGTEKAAPGANE